ncbi:MULTISPECIES: LppU/SCO3897 family protein [unclassified Streptomyces]|uniref:LppU/SCO3897 family protein n=1 Tax=unclassified Streptomyces TaxID=2593676 RepID=UPI0040432821
MPQYGGAPLPPAAPAAVCEVCGAAPAAPVTVRGHQGMLVVMRFLRRRGVLCHTCGLAVFRQMQADTLLQGWWGPMSVLITPVTLLINLGARSAIRRIPATDTTGWRPPLDPGKPVFKRPAGVLALIPLCLLGLVVLAVSALMVIGLVVGPSGSEHPALTVGSCARNDGDWSHQDLRPVDCGSSEAEFRVLSPDSGSCPSGDYLADPEYSKDGDLSLCLRPLNG